MRMLSDSFFSVHLFLLFDSFQFGNYVFSRKATTKLQRIHTFVTLLLFYPEMVYHPCSTVAKIAISFQI